MISSYREVHRSKNVREKPACIEEKSASSHRARSCPTHVEDRGELVDAVERAPHRVKHLTVGAVDLSSEAEGVEVAVRLANEVVILTLTKRLGGASGLDGDVREILLLGALGTRANLLVHYCSMSTDALELGRTIVGDLLEAKENDEEPERRDAGREVGHAGKTRRFE